MLFKHVFVSSMSFLIICGLGITCRHRPCYSLVLPMLVHHCSIAAPSFLHRNDGLSMDCRWGIDGVSSDEKACQYVGFPLLKCLSGKKEKGQILAAMCKNLTFVMFYLCRLALCSRYFAFCLAEPEPWAPVMYFFFFALVLTFPSSCFGLVPPRENEMPLTRMSSKSFAIY